jgi:hypothetical protein
MLMIILIIHLEHLVQADFILGLIVCVCVCVLKLLKVSFPTIEFMLSKVFV